MYDALNNQGRTVAPVYCTRGAECNIAPIHTQTSSVLLPLDWLRIAMTLDDQHHFSNSIRASQASLPSYKRSVVLEY